MQESGVVGPAQSFAIKTLIKEARYGQKPEIIAPKESKKTRIEPSRHMQKHRGMAKAVAVKEV